MDQAAKRGRVGQFAAMAVGAFVHGGWQHCPGINLPDRYRALVRPLPALNGTGPTVTDLIGAAATPAANP